MVTGTIIGTIILGQTIGTIIKVSILRMVLCGPQQLLVLSLIKKSETAIVLGQMMPHVEGELPC